MTVISNIHDGIIMEITFLKDKPFIEIVDGKWHYLQRYGLFPLVKNEKYQLERIAAGSEVPTTGRFRNMLPLSTILSPHMVPVTLQSTAPRYVIRVLEMLVNWLSDNIEERWAFHIRDNIITIFFPRSKNRGKVF